LQLPPSFLCASLRALLAATHEFTMLPFLLLPAPRFFLRTQSLLVRIEHVIHDGEGDFILPLGPSRGRFRDSGGMLIRWRWL
jgi:hypothetical protein